MIDLLSWVVFGLFVGAVARLVVPGRQPIGILWTLILGIAGSIVGGVVAEDVLGVGNEDAFDLGSFVAAVIAASFLVAIAASLVERGRRKEEREG